MTVRNFSMIPLLRIPSAKSDVKIVRSLFVQGLFEHSRNLQLLPNYRECPTRWLHSVILRSVAQGVSQTLNFSGLISPTM